MVDPLARYLGQSMVMLMGLEVAVFEENSVYNSLPTIHFEDWQSFRLTDHTVVVNLPNKSLQALRNMF